MVVVRPALIRFSGSPELIGEYLDEVDLVGINGQLYVSGHPRLLAMSTRQGQKCLR